MMATQSVCEGASAHRRGTSQMRRADRYGEIHNGVNATMGIMRGAEWKMRRS